MSDFYSDFSRIESSEWIEKVKADLKGNSPDETLNFYHPIEGIEYKAYGLSQGPADEHGVPGKPSYLRGVSQGSNDWVINVAIPKTTARECNKQALHHLMNGATGLRINLSNYSVEDCTEAIKDIEFEYIAATFIYHTEEQQVWLKNNFEDKRFDISLVSESEVSELILKNTKSITIKGDELQASGGNVSQEIAWCLHRGHSKLHELLNQGKTIEEANDQLKFRLGIGGNYFFEIAKIRSLRLLWHGVVQAYASDNEELGKAHIEAQTGFTNKSLNDPHTNLLRQTTEALSAVIGGVEELTILPYNWYAESPDLSKTQRLATNIGLLLKEESYLDKVIDPSGGSYNIEALTSEISDKAWKLFQLLEKGKRNEFEITLNNTAKKRIELIQNKKNIHIGVNKYFNTENAVDTWGKLPRTPFGEMLVLEQEIKIEA